MKPLAATIQEKAKAGQAPNYALTGDLRGAKVFLNERSTMMAARSSLPRHSETKLKLIWHHAAVVFAERGFEGASIGDVRRASGVSLAGLYYYLSKQELLYLIQYKVFTSVLESLEQV